MAEPIDPQTLDEWQEAADAAYALLLLDSARKYGLVTGGPAVNVERAEEIIRRAYDDHLIRPAADAAERLVAELLAGRT